jgi:uncharacterized protein (DUF302 family)
VKGKRVTGFTNGEEEAVHLTKVVPFLVEDELKRLGGLYEKVANWLPLIVTDGRLVTGQNPASSRPAAEALLKLLTGSVPAHAELNQEQTTNPPDAADSDLVSLSSAHRVAETAERLKAVLTQKGIWLFAHIDHAAGAKKVGLALRPSQVLIFGNPKAGTPLMQARETVGLDLPLRVLIWEDGEGKVWLTYRRVAALARQHHVTDRDEAVQALDNGLGGLARAAVAP